MIMHVRSSSASGMPVVDDETLEVVGFLREPLIHPDNGRIEGFFVTPAPSSLSGEELFLPALDIIGWGTKVHIRSIDRLSPPGELIRLQPLMTDNRRFLGQNIKIKGTKKLLGVCADVQFDTRHFVVEWLFPRKFLLQQQPLPASDIAEVTKQAIWMRDPLAPAKEEKIDSAASGLVLPEVLSSPQGCQ
jgi:hypothetical protein